MATMFYVGQTDYIEKLNTLADSIAESVGTVSVSAINNVDASSLIDGSVVVAAYRASANDGGGGVFYYSASSTQAEDGGLVFAPTTGSGRLFRSGWTVLGFNGAVRPEWWGAAGSSDDTTALQSMYTALNTIGGGSVEVSKLHTTGVLTIYADTTTYANRPDAGFKVKAGTSNQVILCSGGTRTNIHFYGLTFDGNKANVTGTNPFATFYLATEFSFRRCTFKDIKHIALNISNVVGYFDVSENEFRRVGGNPDGSDGYRKQAVAISSASGSVSNVFTVMYNDFEDIGLDAISIGQARNGRIHGNTSERTGGAVIYSLGTTSSYNSGLSISGNIGKGHGTALGVSPEPNGIDLTYTVESTITGNVMTDFGGCGFGAFKHCDGLTFTGNIARDNGAAGTGTSWRAGFVFGSDSGDPVTNIVASGNIATDTRASGSKTQDYGFQLGLDTLATVSLLNNQTQGNEVGEYGTFLSGAPGTITVLTDWTTTPDTWLVVLNNMTNGVVKFGKSVGIGEYDLADLPAASSVGTAIAIVNDGGTRTLRFSDGTSWLTSSGSAATAAGDVSITDTGAYYTATDVEGALQEIASDVAAISSPAASSVSITDAGAYYTGTNVEAALQEIGADIASLSAASGAQTNVANTFTKAQTSQLVNRGTVTGTVTIDASASNTQRLVLGGNITLAVPTNPMSGQNLGLHIIQDGTGSRTITWNSVFKWASGTAPTLTTTAGGRDFVACTYDDISGVWVCSQGVKGAA